MTSKAIIDRTIAANPTIKPNRIRQALKPMKHLEAQDQANFIEWTHYVYRRFPESFPMLRLIHASMNAGKRSIKQGGRLKAQGLLAGVCDLFLPVPRNGKCGLFIELKIEGGKVSKEQAAFIRDVIDMGYDAHVCYGFKAAVAVVKSYYGTTVG